ncbi:MAG: ABC transporter permease [Bacteroidota bacterium]|jgi:phospholipid/cholesterol/gamma-HCH transport system permease protein
MKFLQNFGEYILFLKAVFTKPEKLKIFRQQIITESYNIGNSSYGIIALISTFIGAVSTIQIGYQFEGSLLPDYLIGRIVRDSNILEFAPTITALVLGGKVGSSIASEIGTMKVTEQIDALEIMGINAASHTSFAKIIGGVITIPMLVLYAMILSLVGGAVSGWLSGIISVEGFVKGLRTGFVGYNVVFAMTKAYTFSFIITSISAFQGFRTVGGALEVGESSTNAVVYSCIGIIFFDFILSQLMLF